MCTSVGGVEADISMSQNTEKIRVHFRDIDISASVPPAGVKLAPKCPFS